MSNQFNTFKSILTVSFLFICSSNTAVLAGEHIFIPKIGIVDWNDNINHNVQNNTFDFDDERVGSLGFTYLFKLDNGFAVGADIFAYAKDIVTTANNRGDSHVSHIYGVAEKFFNNDSAFKPFIGAGLGFVNIRFDANINGDIDDAYDDFALGLSYEIVGGVEIQLHDRVGLILEYKYFDIDVDDKIGGRTVNIESDGDAFFVGVSIHL